ncbi:fungal-specific transcription factor domain-containing protein [Roridomyces roridus]|uniref:Fungal-specific transcription factor domain-containing protein n=1 Tax=Roridomyces roridus TaxID=1738132 RepID=A0AAD7B1B7_9AGAR|nr:fungal-specific transcription factor domain-containing protein [Roridomyces roridus]
MSSDHSAVPAKKRRVQRACDLCRRKRKACDGLRMSEHRCSTCVENGVPCTYYGAVAKRETYVQGLEARLEKTEQLLRKVSGKDAPEFGWSADSAVLGASNSLATTDVGPGVELAALTIRAMSISGPPGPHPEDLEHIQLEKDIDDLELNEHHQRFQDKSSASMLTKAVVVLRQEYEEKELHWESRRMKFWSYSPTKDKVPHEGALAFPEQDLLASLINLYFINVNLFYPVLHRPTLEKCIKDNLHTTDPDFGAVLLLVCAIGSRYSDDHSVLGPEEESLRCGWKYFDQVPQTINHFFSPPKLYHLQYYALATIFLEPSTPSACWALIGLGLRLAQDVGVHRARSRGARPTAEEELWKRGFWVLVSMDRQIAAMRCDTISWFYMKIPSELPFPHIHNPFTIPSNVPVIPYVSFYWNMSCARMHTAGIEPWKSVRQFPIGFWKTSFRSAARPIP